MRRINFSLRGAEHEKSFITLGPGFLMTSLSQDIINLDLFTIIKSASCIMSGFVTYIVSDQRLKG